MQIKFLSKLLFLFNICHLFCIKNFISYYLRATGFFFRSGKIVKKPSCSFYLLLLFFCTNSFAGSPAGLLKALEAGDNTAVERLIEGSEDFDINTEFYNDLKKYDYYETPLMVAAKYGNIQIVSYLIKRGADVEAKNNDHCTALMYAADGGHTQTVVLLVNNGAKINATNKDGKTALMFAASNGYSETVISLAGTGINLNIQDSTDCTALIHAAMNNHPKALIALVEMGADVNIKDLSDRTALIYYMKYGYEDFVSVIELLVKKGAVFDTNNPEHLSALEWAFEKYSNNFEELNTSSSSQETGINSCISNENKEIYDTKSNISEAYWSGFNVFITLLQFLKSDEMNHYFIEQYPSGKRRFVFEKTKEDRICKYILVEDLPALEKLMSNPPLQDAAKYVIRKTHPSTEIDRLPPWQADSIKNKLYLPLKWRLFMEHSGEVKMQDYELKTGRPRGGVRFLPCKP